MEQRFEDQRKKKCIKYMISSRHPSIRSSFLQFYSLLSPMEFSGFEDVDLDFGG